MLLVACAACSKPVTDKPGTCLPLPPATRSALAADPDGDALYWHETVTIRSFDAERATFQRLVRFDLRTRRSERLLDYVAPMMLFMRGKLVMLRPGNRWRIVMLEDDGAVQALTPDYLGVIDVEPLDEHTLVFLATGDGAKAVYTLDLDNPRPEYLADAGVLLSTSGSPFMPRPGSRWTRTRSTTTVSRSSSAPIRSSSTARATRNGPPRRPRTRVSR